MMRRRNPELKVLQAIAAIANPQHNTNKPARHLRGRCLARNGRIAAVAGISTRAVDRALAVLADRGMIARDGLSHNRIITLLQGPGNITTTIMARALTETDAAPAAALRSCLGCRRQFESAGPWQRICDSCKADETWRFAR